MIPLELMREIVLYLDVKSILSLSQCSQTLNGTLNNNSLWRELLLRDYGANTKLWQCGPRIQYEEKWEMDCFFKRLLKTPSPRKPLPKHLLDEDVNIDEILGSIFD